MEREPGGTVIAQTHRQGSRIPTRLRSLALASCLVGIAGAASAQTTTYVFIPTSGSTVTTATIELASPPASGTGAWSTGNAGDVVEVDIVIEADVGPAAPFTVSWLTFTAPYVLTVPTAIASTSGAELDGGVIIHDIPVVVDEGVWQLTFSATPGQDQIAYAASGGGAQAFGDWELAVPAAPIPPAVGRIVALVCAASGCLFLRRRAPAA